jgi:hypothetical protein
MSTRPIPLVRGPRAGTAYPMGFLPAPALESGSVSNMLPALMISWRPL